MTVIADYEVHLRRRNFSKATIRRRIPLLRSFANWLEVPILDANEESIWLFLETRRRAGPRSRYHYLSDFACFFEWALERELVVKNPTAHINRPKLARLLPRPISEADLEVALATARREMFVWLVLGAFAGLRVMEMAGLNVDDVLFDEGVLRVMGKGSKERLVDIHPLVESALLAFGLPRRGAVFIRPRGGRWQPEGVTIEVSQFFEDLGMPWTAHNLRHRFGTKINKVAGLRATQELMGHQNINTTVIYTALERDALRAAVLALPMPSFTGGTHEGSHEVTSEPRSVADHAQPAL